MNKKILLLIAANLILLVQANSMAHVALDHPAGSETFVSGTVVNIQWHIVVDHGDSVWDLLYSPDGGANWETVILGLPKSQLNYLWTVPNVTTSTGVIRVVQNNVTYTDLYDDSGEFIISQTSGVKDNIAQPGIFSLKPAYPNPFNGATVFSFELHQTSHIKLTVYDIRGREIQALIDGEIASGFHAVTWNPHGLSSGVYLYGMTNGENTRIGRVLFLQ